MNYRTCISLSFFLSKDIFLSSILISLSRSDLLRLCAIVLAVSGILSNSILSFFFSICKFSKFVSIFLIAFCSCSNFIWDSSFGCWMLSFLIATDGFLYQKVKLKLIYHWVGCSCPDLTTLLGWGW